jgi:hypothetical protein
MKYTIRSQTPVRIRPFVVELFVVTWWWVVVKNRKWRTLLVGVFIWLNAVITADQPLPPFCDGLR